MAWILAEGGKIVAGVKTVLFNVPSVTLFTTPEGRGAGKVSGGQAGAWVAVAGGRVGEATGWGVNVGARRGVTEGILEGEGDTFLLTVGVERSGVAVNMGVLRLMVGVARGGGVAVGESEVGDNGKGVLTGVSKMRTRANLVGISVGVGVVNPTREQADAPSVRITQTRISPSFIGTSLPVLTYSPQAMPDMKSKLI